MKNNLSKLDKNRFKYIKRIGKLADQKGVNAYLVGGVVRDLLLGRNTKDIDLVIEGDAIQFIQGASYFKSYDIKCYKTFKTISIQIDSDFNIDIVSARSEKYELPGALPRVRLGTLAEDLYRRDFTINAMSLCVNADRFGQIIDLNGGIKDLKRKKIRVMHNKSFFDDPTRILRAVRFEQRFGYQIERATLLQLKLALKKNVFDTISSKRIFNDINKCLDESNVKHTIQRLANLNGLTSLDKGYKNNLRMFNRIDSKISHLRRHLTYSPREFYWLSLVLGQKRGVQNRIIAKFPFEKELKKTFLQFRDLDAIMGSLNRAHCKASDVYQLLNTKTDLFCEYLLFSASGKNFKKIADYLAIKDKKINTLNGQDLKKLGIKSGPMIGRILSRIKLKRIDGEIKSKAQEVKEALRVGI